MANFCSQTLQSFFCEILRIICAWSETTFAQYSALFRITHNSFCSFLRKKKSSYFQLKKLLNKRFFLKSKLQKNVKTKSIRVKLLRIKIKIKRHTSVSPKIEKTYISKSQKHGEYYLAGWPSLHYEHCQLAELRKTKLGKCWYSEMTFALNCAKCCFSAEQFYATEAKICFQKLCFRFAKIVQTFCKRNL